MSGWVQIPRLCRLQPTAWSATGFSRWAEGFATNARGSGLQPGFSTLARRGGEAPLKRAMSCSGHRPAAGRRNAHGPQAESLPTCRRPKACHSLALGNAQGTPHRPPHVALKAHHNAPHPPCAGNAPAHVPRLQRVRDFYAHASMGRCPMLCWVALSAQGRPASLTTRMGAV